MAAIGVSSLREVSRFIRGVLTPIFGTGSYLSRLRELNSVQTHTNPRFGASRRYASWSNMRNSTLAISIST
jgi:hypothetical protein